MSELITKQAMKDMITNHWSDFSNEANYRTALACVDAVPPIQPRREERKIGEWIYDWGDWDFETCKCSECGNHSRTEIGKRYNFCPYCGADMREVTNGN